MIFWYWYILTAAALSFNGDIKLNILLTLLLAALVHVQFQIAASDRRFLTILKIMVIAAAAAALLWRESFLPPASTVLSLLADPVTRPSAGNLAEFMLRHVNMLMVAVVLLLFAAIYVLSRKGKARYFLFVYSVLLLAWVIQLFRL